MSGAAKGDAVYEGVVKQLEILGSDHVGYTGKAFRAKSGAHFSVVGARPFSKVHLLLHPNQLVVIAHPSLLLPLVLGQALTLISGINAE